MNKETFISNLRDPDPNRSELNGILQAFPYFQTAHLLQAKIRKSEGHHLSDIFTRSASLYSVDRTQLHELLNSNIKSSSTVVYENRSIDSAFSEPIVGLEIPVHEEVEPKTVKPDYIDAAIIPESSNDAIPIRNSAIMDEVLANLQALRDAKKHAQVNFESVVEFKPSLSEPEKHSIPEIQQSKEKRLQYKVNTFVAPIDYKNHELQDGRLGEITGTIGQLDILQNYLSFLKRGKSPVLEEQLSVIESFIKRNPSISKPTEAGLSQHKIDFSQKSSKESAELVTENLANIFIKQKKYSKAIEIYQKLSLKYPEKSTYFAQKITELQNL